MKIYESTEQQFSNNGLGVIKPLKCIEYKNKSLDGWYIEVTVSIDYKDVIQQDYIAFVSTKEKGGQPFRINNVSFKNRLISFTAYHIVFDAERYLLDDVRPTNQTAASYLSYVNQHTDTESPFFITSDIAESATSYFVRKTLMDALITAEEVFGGYYDVDGFNITLKNHIGNDNGVCVIYGKNIEDMNVVEDWSGVCTKILPEGTNGILLPETYLTADVQYQQPFTRTVKFETDTENEDGASISEKDQIIELRQMAKAYLEENKHPKISYVAKASPDDELCIGDTIHIKHPLCTIDAQVFSYTYDTISKKVTEIVFGNYKPTARRAVASIKNEIAETNKRITFQESVIQSQTDLINSQFKNGYIYIDDNELLILDKIPKEKAKNVWRFNMGGLGFSNNGYLGPFSLAITQDGKINADFINAGTIRGISLIGNTITNGNNFSVDTKGNMKALSGLIGNWHINEDGLYSEFEREMPDFTKQDVDKIVDYILGNRKLTNEEINRYDLTRDGKVTSMDLVLIEKMIEGIDSKKWKYKVCINPRSSDAIIDVTVDRGNGKEMSTRISPMSIVSPTIDSIYNAIDTVKDTIELLESRISTLENK